MRGSFKKFFSQFGLVSLLLIIQIAVLFFITELNDYQSIISALMVAISIFVVFYILNKKDNPAFQLAWIVPILIFPVFGGLFYLILQAQKFGRGYNKRIEQVKAESKPYLKQDEGVLKELEALSTPTATLARYMDVNAGYSVVDTTETRYLASGEEYIKVLLEELKKAKRYIYLEYFIIEQGRVWDSVLDILKRKVLEGVDVRVIYDGIGSGTILPFRYTKFVESFGIRCCEFSKFVPFLTVLQNNRDHRKIVAIDGCVAFTGGVNLADEYANLYVRFGHWRDSGLMLKGDAAFNFAAMFLQQWSLGTGEQVFYHKARPTMAERSEFKSDGGFVMPYGECPLDDEKVGENVYLDIINRAERYLYISTPYLILDSELTTALIFAAKRGVDLRIIVPGMPDKWYAYEVTCSYFEQLIEAGVKIYTYTPGFMHSKNFVSDDSVAVVGSINLDYRSLYLHYECAAYMYRSSAVKAIKTDFDRLFPICHEVVKADCKVGVFRFALRSFLRLFGPLM